MVLRQPRRISLGRNRHGRLFGEQTIVAEKEEEDVVAAAAAVVIVLVAIEAAVVIAAAVPDRGAAVPAGEEEPFV